MNAAKALENLNRLPKKIEAAGEKVRKAQAAKDTAERRLQAAHAAEIALRAELAEAHRVLRGLQSQLPSLLKRSGGTEI